MKNLSSLPLEKQIERAQDALTFPPCGMNRRAERAARHLERARKNAVFIAKWTPNKSMLAKVMYYVSGQSEREESLSALASMG